MIAGRDTTACALTWCVYELVRHPEVRTRSEGGAYQASLFSAGKKEEEEEAAAPRPDADSAKTNAERYSALRKMKYTEAYTRC